MIILAKSLFFASILIASSFARHHVNRENGRTQTNLRFQHFNSFIDSNNETRRFLANDGDKQEAGFLVTEINHDNTVIFPSEVYVEIINPKSPQLFWYSVTITSYRRYTGTATLMSEIDETHSSLIFSWKPLFSGVYEIIVHELEVRGRPNIWKLPLSQPISIIINERHDGSVWHSIQEDMEKLIPCQNFVDRVDLYINWDGHWIGPDMDTKLDRLRTGWLFLPSREMNCKIEIFSDDDFGSISEEKSIHVFGTSRERGIFLSLLDLLLSTDEKKYLKHSVIGTCWGRAFVVKSKLKIFYQDWRTSQFESPGAERSILCHNDKIARGGEELFVSNALKVWEEIFQDPVSWPSVILMNTENSYIFDGRYDLQQFISSIPSAWSGTLFLTDGTFNAMGAGRGDSQHYDMYKTKLQQFTNIMNDKRIR